jgi:hypothetical protein
VVAGRALEREQRDRGRLVVGHVAGSVLERAGAHQREAVAERQLLGLDHQSIDGREHDRQRAAVVGGGLEVGERLGEARRVERELRRVRPDRGQEGLEGGVGL